MINESMNVWTSKAGVDFSKKGGTHYARRLVHSPNTNREVDQIHLVNLINY